ncbi:MAG TPA: hypothetical protein VKE22_24455 [Haliangiales bacterium]|nr:hypothetical protein [Haliangiales bacterium]
MWCLAALAACGMGAASGGGTDHLPVSGAGPYGDIGDQPVVFADPGADLTSPTAIALEGGGFRIWYARAGEIWRVDLGDGPGPAGEPAPALAADRAWEAGAVGNPSVTPAPGGGLLMVYEAAGQVGAARSNDGVAWMKDAAPLGDGHDPSAVYAGDELFVYVADGGAIRRLGGDVVLSASTDPLAFDSAAVAEPTAAFGTTVAGRRWIGLFYVGANAAGRTLIGFAGSGDGATFTRPPRGRPILAAPSIVSERGPAPVVLSDRAYLFYNRVKSGRWAIAAALSTTP